MPPSSLPLQRSETSTVIGRNHPTDGQEWDVQCARCGSSLEFDVCQECCGDGFVESDPESEHDYEPCNICFGQAAFPRCLSREDWCKANPLPGREAIEWSTPEWFVVKRAKASR